MQLAELVLALRPLLAAPLDNEGAIGRLLAAHTELAEYEVARFLAARALGPRVHQLAASEDPRERRRAIDLLRLTMARVPAANLLRRLVKDRDRRVRRAAWSTVRRLHLDDVALPDRSHLRKFPPLKARVGVNPFTKQPMIFAAQPAHVGVRSGTGPFSVGGFNPTGWGAGVIHHRRSKPRPLDALARLETPADVARLVGLADAGALTRLLRPGVGPGAPYVSFEIPKASGGVRTITAPRAELKAVQRALLREIFGVAEMPAHDACHGFVPGRSTVTHAAHHVGAQVILKFDLRDFFPTVHHYRVVGLLRHHGASRPVAELIAGLVTHRPVLADGRVAWPSVLPQGAPTSPAIANLVCRRLDARLEKLAARADAVYTRYADDLAFSFKSEPSLGIGRFAWWVDQICHQEGFFENTAKRRVLRPSTQQRLTGLVVNDKVAVPREARRRFRALLDRCRKQGVSAETVGHPDPRAYLGGFAAYLAMVQPEAGARALAEVRALLEGS